MASPSALSPLEVHALVALVHEERSAEAEVQARTLLKRHPGAGILWKILSVALVRQGKDALQALAKTVELMSDDAEAHRNLGAALYDRGQWAAALASFKRSLALEPAVAGTLVEAANTLRQLGRPAEALPLYQRAVQLDPLEAEGHNNLGNAHLEMRQYVPAERAYRQALQISPGHPQVLCNLGAVQSALGQRAGAVDSFRLALEHNPQCIEALHGLGNALRDLGERCEAVPLLGRAVELDPRRAESHGYLGAALFETRRVQEAIASFNQALACRADYAPAHLGLALARRQQRRPDEAEQCCLAALAAQPEYPEALCLLGELRADRGRFAEAEELFSRAIAIDPDFAPAYSSIATHRRMGSEDGQWLEGALRLVAARLPLTQDIGLHYALGKYFDDTAQYDRAFEHYRRANEANKRLGPKYERGQLSARVDQIMGELGASFIQQAGKLGTGSELPVFIVGMPRSGTSLAEQILASHPSVHGAGELLYWNGAYEAYRTARAQADHPPGDLARMAEGYLAKVQALGDGAARVVDKMPANFWYCGLLHAALPRARIIHMQRHPFDTCLSVYFQNFYNIGPYAHDLADLAHFYGEYRRVMEHWRRVLPADAMLEVPYEALVDQPETWARRMLAFVGLPWDPRCLEFHRTDRVVITASKWQVRQKISKGSVGRWRHYEQHIGPLRSLEQGVAA